MLPIASIKRIPITLLLAGFAVCLHIVGDLQPYFTFNFRDFPLLELYRVLTCHFLHWSAEHLHWDLAVFIVLGALCESRSLTRYASTLLLSAAAIPLCTMTFLPNIDSYRGLSGIDTALFGLLVTELIIERTGERDWSGAALSSLCMLGLFAKITTEMICHHNIFLSDASFTPIPLSHFIGAIVGIAIGAFQSRGWRETCRLAIGSCAKATVVRPLSER